MVEIDLVTKFVQQALRGEPIKILGQHTFERLDIRDAVDGIVEFLEVPPIQWNEVYNLGRGETLSIGKLADEVISQVEKIKGKTSSQIITNYVDDSLHFGMDSNTFY